MKRLRNSEGANKPFRSPFSTPRNSNVNQNENTPECSLNKTPSRAVSSKRSLFQQTPPQKRPRLSKDSMQNRNITECTELCDNDLEALKRRIKDKQERIANLKRTLLYKKKNKAEDIEAAIEKWTTVCQDALKDYYEEANQNNIHGLSMYHLLLRFGIDPKVVRYSVDDDMFY